MSASEQNMNNRKFIKAGVSPEDIKIYELYLKRWAQETDLIWRRFQIFWGFTSLLFVAMAFLMTSSFHGQNGQSFSFLFTSSDVWKLVLDLSISGLIGSVFWVLASINANYRQNAFNQAIRNIEKDIFDFPEKNGIAHGIEAGNSSFKGLDITHKGLDVVLISIWMSWLYVFIFIVLIGITYRLFDILEAVYFSRLD